MCAIVGSFSSSKLLELVEINSYRGQHSYSFSIMNRSTGILSIIEKGIGPFNKSIVNIPGNCYGIAHIQAPTTESTDIESVHPCIVLGSSGNVKHALWHNGILKHNTIEQLKDNTDITWDTKLMLLEVIDNGWDALNIMDGTFSCIYYKEKQLFHFRNNISPMFIDDDMNISSTKFKGSSETKPEAILKFDLRYNELIEISKFKTVNNPYFFGDDV